MSQQISPTFPPTVKQKLDILLTDLDELAQDKRPTIAELAKEIHINLQQGLRAFSQGNQQDAEQIFQRAHEKKELVKKVLQAGNPAEEYVKGWLETLITVSAIVATLALTALTLLPKTSFWQVNFVISLLVFLSTSFLLATAWLCLEAHSTLIAAVRHGRDAYMESANEALWAKRCFRIGLLFIVLSTLAFAISHISISILP